MRVGNGTLRLFPCVEEDPQGYVTMRDGAKYAIVVRNSSAKQGAHVDLFVDGVSVFRQLILPPMQVRSVKRPESTDRAFIATRRRPGDGPSVSDAGTVQARFYFQRMAVERAQLEAVAKTGYALRVTRGAAAQTDLGDATGQVIGHAQGYDVEDVPSVTVTLRIVIAEEGPKWVGTVLREPQANPVPPPVA